MMKRFLRLVCLTLLLLTVAVPAYGGQAEKQVSTGVGYAHMYASPSAGSALRETFQNGAVMQVIAEYDGWAYGRIRTPEQYVYGYILLSNLTDAPAAQPPEETLPEGSQAVQNPDLRYTVVNRSSVGVQRTPGTEILSFTTENMDVAYCNAQVGWIAGNQAGSTTLHLTEYDSVNNITYKTAIHVTVEAQDAAIEWNLQLTSAER